MGIKSNGADYRCNKNCNRGDERFAIAPAFPDLPPERQQNAADTALHSDDEFLAILEEMGEAGQSFKSELLSIEITKE